ncbi:MAG: glycosyltransferase family 2 protein [Opitutaceae bacterium]
MSTSAAPALSAVICCYNEEPNIDELLRRTSASFEATIGPAWEIVLVDDGSTDATWLKISQAGSLDPRIVGIRLSRNFGHQAALTAGLEHAAGNLIFILDADLQDPPELFPRFHQAIIEGADVAFGQRVERRGETAFKRGTARLFYRVLNFLSDAPIHRSVGDFRLITRPVLELYLSLPENHRFARGLFSWLGGVQTAIPYSRDPRAAGETHYSLARMSRLALDALTGFSTVPLRFCGYLGIVSICFSLGLFAYIAVSYIAFNTARGWTSLAAIVTFFGSAQLISLSIIGEYVGRVYMQSKGRPHYIASSAVNRREIHRSILLGRYLEEKANSGINPV